MDRVFRNQLEGHPDSIEIEIEIDESLGETECDCNCIEHGKFLKAKKLCNDGHEKEAVELFSECIIDHRHSLALEHYVSLVISNLPQKEELVGELLKTMHVAADVASDMQFNIKCQKFRPYDLEKLIEHFGVVFEKSRHAVALHYQGQAFLLRAQREDTLTERCFESFESHLIYEVANPCHLDLSHFCLALCYFRRYCSTGYLAYLEIGVQHCTSLSARNESLAIFIALLIEKGSLSRREFEKVDALPKDFSELLSRSIDLRKMLKNIFLWSSVMKYRIPWRGNVSSSIYSKFVFFNEAGQCTVNISSVRATNRLALMYQRGFDGLPRDFAKAESLYTQSIKDGLGRRDVHVINAMCNLTVLYGQRNDVLESPRNHMELVKNAIEEFEEKEKCEIPLKFALEDHSPSMNNLAVIMEREEKDIEGAKQLYQRSVSRDKNPIAMYNFALLLKFEDPSPENLEKAETLFCDLADLGADLQSMPVLNAQLTKARALSANEITEDFRVDTEEIDDCLAYVKIVVSTS